MVRMLRHGSSLSSMRYRTSPAVQVVQRDWSLSDSDLAPRGVSAFLDRQALLFDGMAGHFAALDRQRLRPLDLAALVGERTAWMEGAACGRIDRARHLARHRRALAAGHVEIRDGVQQHARIGVLGPYEQRLGRRL